MYPYDRLNPAEINQLIAERITEIVTALDESPATNAIVEALALLTLSAYAAQAGSIAMTEKATIADWIRDSETAWRLAQTLRISDNLQWMNGL